LYRASRIENKKTDYENQTIIILIARSQKEGEKLKNQTKNRAMRKRFWAEQW
jgi:hypothetical protein